MQTMRRPIARDHRIQIFGSRQITAALRIQTAVASECPSNLTNPVGTEVETDAGVLVADRRERLVAGLGANERQDEFVGYAFVVGLFYALNRIGVFPAFTDSIHHGTERLGDSLPTAVAIHRIIPAIHAGDFADVILAHLLLKLL